MRLVCKPASSLQWLKPCRPPRLPRPDFFCRTAQHHNHAHTLAYSSGRAIKASNLTSRPSSFSGKIPSQFNKAQHESIYLYKALSSPFYVFGCYVSGILMISIGIFNHSTIAWANEKAIEEKKPLQSFVPVFTFVGSLFIVGIGCYFIFAKPRNLCQSIRSLPAVARLGRSELLLEIERASWLPFTKPAILRVPPSDLTLIGSLKAEQRLRLYRGSAEESGKFGPIWLLQNCIRGIFRAVTNSGYLKLQVKGYFYAWKVDSRLAWAYEEGQSLESLIEVIASDQR